jgi:hypothetical protein
MSLSELLKSGCGWDNFGFGERGVSPFTHDLPASNRPLHQKIGHRIVVVKNYFICKIVSY